MKTIVLTKDYKIGAKVKKRGTELQVLNSKARELIGLKVARYKRFGIIRIPQKKKEIITKT